VGSMDRSVWWDEKTAAAAAHRTVKKYFYKIGKLHT
jgi:hypothetical protein